MSIKINNEIGDITIKNEVVATIAAVAAMECYGLVGMTYKSAKSHLPGQGRNVGPLMIGL